MRSPRLSVLIVCCCLGVQATACDDKKDAPTATATATATPSASPVASPSASPSASAMAIAAAPSSTPSASATGSNAPFVVPDAITAQHILIAYKGAKGSSKTTRSKADAKKRAEEVLAKAKAAGSDFTALVMEYSDDPGSKERQGSVGKFTRDKMVKPFSDAAFALRVDEISNIVESDFGFHIIKRNQ